MYFHFMLRQDEEVDILITYIHYGFYLRYFLFLKIQINQIN